MWRSRSRLRRLREERGIQRDSGVWSECLGCEGIGVGVWRGVGVEEGLLRGWVEVWGVIVVLVVVMEFLVGGGIVVSKLGDGDLLCVGVEWVGLSMPLVVAWVICADNGTPPVLTQGRTVNDDDNVSGMPRISND